MVQRLRVPAILVFLLSLFLLILSSVPASAAITSWGQIDEKTRTKVVEPLWKEFRAAGFSAEATAGIMGNLAQESSFNPMRVGGKNNSCYGIIQWCPSERDVPEGLVEAVNAGNYDKSAEIQVKAVVQEVQAGGWLEVYWNNVPTYTTGQLAGFSFQDLSPNPGPLTPETFKKLTNIDTAVAVMLALERPCPNFTDTAFRDTDCKKEMDRRVPQAKIIYEALKNVDGSPSSETTEEGVSLEGTLPTEDELLGMPDKRDYLTGPDGSVASLPGVGTLNPDEGVFSGSEILSLGALERTAQTEQSEQVPTILRTAISLAGLFLIFYSVLLLIAYVFDRSNTLVQIQMYKALTFGKRHVPASADDTSKGSTAIKTAFLFSGIAALMGVLLITGALMQLLLTIFFWIQTWF